MSFLPRGDLLKNCLSTLQKDLKNNKKKTMKSIFAGEPFIQMPEAMVYSIMDEMICEKTFSDIEKFKLPLN